MRLLSLAKRASRLFADFVLMGFGTVDSVILCHGGEQLQQSSTVKH